MSTATIATILLLGVFLVLVFLRVPVVYAIGVASLLDFFYLGINPMQMALKFVSNLNSYTLLAVPFFILMGELMSAGGITDTLIAFSKELVGWMRGGAAMVNVVASFFFGGISGSSSADCASLGPIEIKMMEEQGYDREFSTCLTMASSVEGILVPPSQNMVIFTLAAAGVTTVSIGQLFVAEAHLLYFHHEGEAAGRCGGIEKHDVADLKMVGHGPVDEAVVADKVGHPVALVVVGSDPVGHGHVG